METLVALHDANHGEMPTTDWLQKRWVFFGGPRRRGRRPPRQTYMLKGGSCPRTAGRRAAMEAVHAWEKVALYFAWLAFYGIT